MIKKNAGTLPAPQLSKHGPWAPGCMQYLLNICSHSLSLSVTARPTPTQLSLNVNTFLSLSICPAAALHCTKTAHPPASSTGFTTTAYHQLSTTNHQLPQVRHDSPSWLVDETERTRRGLLSLRQNVVLLVDDEDRDRFYPR